MGSWFSNLHIRKSEKVTAEKVAGYMIRIMAGQRYVPATSEEADTAVAIVAGDAEWISVCSEVFAHDDPASCAKIATPLSSEFHTDVLGISCFDSDYLYLNLINSGEQTDAWIGIGSAAGLGIKRRSGLTAWKKKVSDYPLFSECAKKKYICAEEFLMEIESCIGLPMARSAASPEYMDDLGLDQEAVYLYFKLADDAALTDPPRLRQWMSTGTPCFSGKSSYIEVRNHGGEGKGLSVFFVGPYVEHEDITFTNVEMLKWERGRQVPIPISLNKVQLTDGQWAYHYQDPQYRLLPKANDRAPIQKQHERSICLQFTPVGDPRKMLDITVVLQPDQNPAGQTGWNVWYPWGSKKAFIEQHNKLWKRVRKFEQNPDSCLPLLREEDFD